MAGRHRKPPAWRRTLTSLLRTRNKVRTAALRAEILALRATIASMQEELDTLRAEAAARLTGPTAAPAPGLVTLDLPLVRLALADIEVDRGLDTVVTEIRVTDPVPAAEAAAAEGTAAEDPVRPEVAERPEVAVWPEVAELPERPLLDPRLARDTEPVDVAIPDETASPVVVSTAPAPVRRSA